MKILQILFFSILLVPNQSQAQKQPRPHHAHFKKHGVNLTHTLSPKDSKIIGKLSIGDTCYITTNNLALRSRPRATAPSVIYLQRNAKVIIREVLTTQWLLVDYYNQDVGVDGCVPMEYILKKCKKCASYLIERPIDKGPFRPDNVVAMYY